MSSSAVVVDPELVRAAKFIKEPSSLKDVRALLSFVDNYYNISLGFEKTAKRLYKPIKTELFQIKPRFLLNMDASLTSFGAIFKLKQGVIAEKRTIAY